MVLKLVAFDLDGTILEHGTLIRPEVIEALRTISGNGIACSTATGRQFAFQEPLFEEYGIGAGSGVLRALIGDEREIFLAEGGEWISLGAWNDPMKARWAERYPLAMEFIVQAEAESARRGFDVHRLHDDTVSFTRGLPSLVYETASEAREMEAWIEDLLREREVPLQTNRNVRLVQIFDIEVGKGKTLERLARHLGIANEDVLALGDSSNDYTMLNGRLGFRCATFDNAEDELKEMVRAANGYVAQAAAGLGVVESFRHYGLV
jgi:HAD superfamily hydrolase (TIGR01484 family)